MTAPLLCVENLSVEHNRKKIIDNLNLSVHANEILGIVGVSGCGKSTLLKSVMGLLESPLSITRGKVLYQQEDLLSISPKKRHRLRGKDISMIFQDTASALCPVRKIGIQIDEMLKAHGQPSLKKKPHQILDLFRDLNLEDGQKILNAYPFELSGGMNQRVGIALAMLLESSLILADEPTSALDVVNQKQVVAILKQMCQIHKSAMIVVSHNIAFMAHLADRIAIMHQGHIVECGSVADIIHTPQSDYTKELIQSIPTIKK